PETLLICKCVCKLWYNLIIHPSFVNKHLRFTVQNSKLSLSSSVSLFLKWTRQELSEDDIFNVDHQELDLSKQFLSLVTISKDIAANSNSDSTSGDLLPCVIELFSFPSVPELEQVDLIGSHCNGIICFLDRRREDTVIWCNPVLRKFNGNYRWTNCFLPPLHPKA
ncbi:F-box domain containing protein, partial [Parasponia andersonii]